VRRAAGALLLALVGLAAGPATGSNFSHIKTWNSIWSATEADLDWLATHNDFPQLYSSLLPGYKARNPDGIVWVYWEYNSITGQSDYDSLRAYCETHGLAFEDMFVHFATDTRHRPGYEDSGSDGSTEDKLDTVWVYNGSLYTDRTSAAYGGAGFDIGDAAGWILYVGGEEPFKEVNFTLSTPASANWSGVWEYWNGSTWASLSPTDGTSDMTASGKVEKMPPPMSSWKRTSVNGVSRWWWRLRTTSAGSTQPVVSGGGLKGRNYITFSGGYYTQPGWSSANDTDGDGVWDTNVNSSATAVFRHEARAHYYEFRTSYLNMGDANCRAWITERASYYVTQTYSGYTYDGLFLDNAMGTLTLNNLQSGGSTVEDTSPSTFATNSILAILAAKAGVAGKVVFINTGNYYGEPYESYIVAAGGDHAENWIQIDRTYGSNKIDYVISRSASGRVVQVKSQGVAAVDGDLERDRMFSLALYYLSAGPTTYYCFGQEGQGPQPNDFKSQWYAAIEHDVGQPSASYYVLATPTDSSTGAPAPIYARMFGKALAVCCPLPQWNSSYSTSYTLDLPSYSIGGGQTSNRYQWLYANGTLGSPVTQVTLRNADGAVLIKTDAQEPALTLSASGDPAEAAPADTVTFTFTQTNTSDDTLLNLVLTNPIPQYTTYVPNSTRVNGETVSPDPYADGEVSVTIASLAAGASATVEFQVTVD